MYSWKQSSTFSSAPAFASFRYFEAQRVLWKSIVSFDVFNPNPSISFLRSSNAVALTLHVLLTSLSFRGLSSSFEPAAAAEGFAPSGGNSLGNSLPKPPPDFLAPTG